MIWYFASWYCIRLSQTYFNLSSFLTILLYVRQKYITRSVHLGNTSICAISQPANTNFKHGLWLDKMPLSFKPDKRVFPSLAYNKTNFKSIFVLMSDYCSLGWLVGRLLWLYSTLKMWPRDAVRAKLLIYSDCTWLRDVVRMNSPIFFCCP